MGISYYNLLTAYTEKKQKSFLKVNLRQMILTLFFEVWIFFRLQVSIQIAIIQKIENLISF